MTTRMYAAGVGIPSPKRMLVIIASNRTTMRTPPPKEIIRKLIFCESPVCVIKLTMTPSPARMEINGAISIAPCLNPFREVFVVSVTEETPSVITFRTYIVPIIEKIVYIPALIGVHRRIISV